MSSFTDTPKPILYRRLKENYNLNRYVAPGERSAWSRVQPAAQQPPIEFHGCLRAASTPDLRLRLRLRLRLWLRQRPARLAATREAPPPTVARASWY